MPLDPLIKALNDQAAAAPQTERTIEGSRAAYDGIIVLSGDPAEMAEVENLTIPGPAGEIPVRIYRPSAEDGLPVCLYFHGGGFVIGSLESHDPICRELAASANVTIVSVDYRLAPEHAFPAGIEDCWAATQWVAAHGEELRVDASRLAVAGDSAGGNLAAVMTLRARDAGGPSISFQLLIYPATSHEEFPSRAHPDTQTLFLNLELMRWFWQNYVPENFDPDSPELSPLLAEDLSGLPPALVVTAECDPLRDEGEAYAKRLLEAGVAVEYRQIDAMPHAFFHMAGALPAAKATIAEAAEALGKALA